MNKIPASLIKQVILLLSILTLGIVLTWQLWYFVPGVLGALTLYVCFRKWFFYLSIVKKWKKWLAIFTIMTGIIALLILPIWGVIALLLPKINYAVSHPEMFINVFDQTKALVSKYLPEFKISESQIQNIFATGSDLLSQAMSGATQVVVNIAVAFFILYFMFFKGRELEKGIQEYMPLKPSNSNVLWHETRNMIISNAVGIPLLVICQCLVAILGYWIFDVDQFVFWGLLTGVASIIPVVGSMIIYLPLSIYIFATGDTGGAIGVFIYSAIVTSNIDNVLRFTLLKRIGDVHPLITVFGVILGLQVFGLMGLIFGPLLLAYFILLFRVYYREFTKESTEDTLPQTASTPEAED